MEMLKKKQTKNNNNDGKDQIKLMILKGNK